MKILEEDYQDEYDEGDTSTCKDFARLISDVSEKPSLGGTVKSFEILPASSGPAVYKQSKLGKIKFSFCLLPALVLSGLLFLTILYRETNGNVSAAAEEDDIPFRTFCQKRFNMTYGELLDQLLLADQESFCGPEQPDCKCQSPFIPSKLDWRESNFLELWDTTHQRNKASANFVPESPYDVVFFGDSITEHWDGTDLAINFAKWAPIHDVFQDNFSKEHGGKVEGLALGIGGDRCPQLLYRLENGELPDTLQSQVFWVLIGTNNLADHCTVENIVAGNIQIVEKLRSLRPNAKVVVNSILPRGKPGMDLFTERNGKSEWRTTITTINQWLECYADDNDHHVEFFNGTGVFLQPPPNETSTLEEYYSDDVHPSPTGHAAWAAAIVERVLDLIGH